MDKEQYSTDDKKQLIHLLHTKKYERKKINKWVEGQLGLGSISSEVIKEMKERVRVLTNEIVMLEKKCPRPLTHPQIEERTKKELPPFDEYYKKKKKRKTLILFLPELVDIKTATENYEIFKPVIRFAVWEADKNNEWQYIGWEYIWNIDLNSL